MKYDETGIERLCVGIFERTKDDHDRLVRKLRDPETGSVARANASRRLKEMERDFLSGEMDVYTDIFDTTDSLDIWNGIARA